MYEFYLRNKEKLDKIFFILGFLVLSYVFFVYLFKYIAPFVIAFIFSIVIEPLVRFLNIKFKINRGVAGIICILVSLMLFYFLGSILFTTLIKQIYSFALSFPLYLTDLTDAIELAKMQFANYFEIIPLTFMDYFNNLVPKLIDFLTNSVGTMVKNKSVDFVSLIPSVLMNILVFILTSFFMIKDKAIISRAIAKYCPAIIISQVNILKKGLFAALGGYVKAQLIIMSIVSTISITMLLIIGYPYALLVGLMIGIVDALPLLGSGAILWPWSLITLITEGVNPFLKLIVLYVINTLTRQFLEPKVLSTQIGLYPIITLMSIYAGLKIFGVAGVFLGPIIAVSIKVLSSSYHVNKY